MLILNNKSNENMNLELEKKQNCRRASAQE